eukprot:2536074-Rhodomonas_salina.2
MAQTACTAMRNARHLPRVGPPDKPALGLSCRAFTLFVPQFSSLPSCVQQQHQQHQSVDSEALRRATLS